MIHVVDFKHCIKTVYEIFKSNFLWEGVTGGGGAIYPQIRLIFLFLIGLVSSVGNCRKSSNIELNFF